MLFVTQLVYVHPGKEKEFDEFEARVLPLLPKYGGELLMRLRPDAASMLAGTLEKPYEVHLVRFEDQDGLARYTADDERVKVLALKDEAVKSQLVVKGRE
jgi:uncharacterized protein (DUF1330 family)